MDESECPECTQAEAVRTPSVTAPLCLFREDGPLSHLLEPHLALHWGHCSGGAGGLSASVPISTTAVGYNQSSIHAPW